MPYYHATHKARLPSILAHGLGWAGAARNWPDSASGVYLAEEPAIAVGVMLEWYAEEAPADLTPREALTEIVVLVIDDSRVPRRMLGPDPSISRDGVWLYRGVLDVRNMPVVTIDDALLAP